MSGQSKPVSVEDSLERIERLMAIEESFTGRIEGDPQLDVGQRERLIRELQAQFDHGEFGDDFDDDNLAAFVVNSGHATFEINRGRRHMISAAISGPFRHSAWAMGWAARLSFQTKDSYMKAQ